jgi:hypothetical protein
VIHRFLILAFLLPALSAAQEAHDHPAPEKLGTVSFPISCQPGVQQEFATITYVAGTQFLRADGKPVPDALLATPDGKPGLKAEYTQFGTGTVRMCLPLPIKSTIAQRSSRRCKLPKVSSASSRRRRPHPSRMARIARLRFPVRVCSSGTCQSAAASPAVSQLPKREPSLRTPLTP